MSIEGKIQQAIDAKEGNKELAIFFFPADEGDEDSWSVEIGNDCKYVRLGEVDGEVVGRGRSLDEALDSLIVEMAKERKVDE
jgi:hypothetical protein